MRALGAGVVAGALALAGLSSSRDDAHALSHELAPAPASPAVIVSALAGLATLVLVYRRRFEPARYSAALAVAAIVAGWALAQRPTILPGPDVGRRPPPTTPSSSVVVAVLGGGAILFPSLALLFRLTLAGRFRRPPSTSLPPAKASRAARAALLVRFAAACLIVGFGLLTVADAAWAHAVGVGCLGGFVVLAFGAIVAPVLDKQTATP